MNEQLQQALIEVCDRPGITVEHLWQALITQAYIEGAGEMTALLIFVLCSVLGFRLVMKKTTTPTGTEENQYPKADWDDEFKCIAWFLWGILSTTTLLTVLAYGPGAVGALVNPEYWALTQLLP